MDIDSRIIWINDGSRIFKMKTMQPIPQAIGTDDNDDVVKRINSIKQLSTSDLSGICITEVTAPNDPRGWSSNLGSAKHRQLKGLVTGKCLRYC